MAISERLELVNKTYMLYRQMIIVLRLKSIHIAICFSKIRNKHNIRKSKF